MYPGGNLIGDEEEQAVLEVLRSKRLFRYYGPQPGPSRVAQLEAAFAAHMGAQKAIAVSSGTAALMCGLAGIGVGPGDEVIVPAYTWIASASAVVMMGGIPIVAEVDDTLTLNPADVERKVTPRTKAIMPVHMRGAPARLDELLALARGRGLRVIEDAAQADGGGYGGQRLGTLWMLTLCSPPRISTRPSTVSTRCYVRYQSQRDCWGFGGTQPPIERHALAIELGAIRLSRPLPLLNSFE